jgi:hypothetical protein
MKLASYVANGKACFGAVTGDGVITLNDRLGACYASLREALAAGALADEKGRRGRPPDPARLTLITRLNGQEVQRSGTDLLIHSVGQIVAFYSHFTPLAPGEWWTKRNPGRDSGHGRASWPAVTLDARHAYFGSLSKRAGVSGSRPPRWRARVSRPLRSQSPLAARRAKVSQRSVQSPRS